MRGRKPLPEHIKALHGRSHHAKDEVLKRDRPLPAGPDGWPKLSQQPPKELTDAEAVEWRIIAADCWWLRGIDRALLLIYLHACTQHRLAAETLTREGMNVVINGRLRPHPAEKSLNSAGKIMLRLGATLGLSPAGRKRLGIPDVIPSGPARRELF